MLKEGELTIQYYKHEFSKHLIWAQFVFVFFKFKIRMHFLHDAIFFCSILAQIWVLKSKVQECQKCGLKCHKRCIDYCTKQVPCYQKTFEDLQQRSEGDFAVYEREELGVQISNGHRLLDQQRTGCKIDCVYTPQNICD